MNRRTFGPLLGLVAAGYLFGLQPALAQDKLKLAVGQRGNWDTSVSEVGQRAGIFKKHGLELEIVYTQGAGETQQAAISGSVDIGVAAGIMGVRRRGLSIHARPGEGDRPARGGGLPRSRR